MIVLNTHEIGLIRVLLASMGLTADPPTDPAVVEPWARAWVLRRKVETWWQAMLEARRASDIMEAAAAARRGRQDPEPRP